MPNVRCYERLLMFLRIKDHTKLNGKSPGRVAVALFLSVDFSNVSSQNNARIDVFREVKINK